MSKLVLISLAVGVLCVVHLVSASVPGVHRLSKNTRVSYRGIGAIRAGMSLAAAASVVGDKLVSTQEASDGCTFVKPQHGPNGISFMVIDGKIARVDVENSFTKTEEGARVGDSEATIKRLYAGRVRVTPHAYVEGHYLTIVAPDHKHAIVFETDGKKVTEYRAGRLVAVGYVEGCS
jgi:hypothetical protein